ncbi:DUF3310 domain-containing protein [Patescibacteria group bacterium]|nr:DUF3310 domain-containing protein [Patescibacteria group bacterium]
MSTANNMQVGGSHYAPSQKVQHWDICADCYGYAWFAGNATKYIVRFGKKDKGAEGLEKAVHYLQKAQELGGLREHRFFYCTPTIVEAQNAAQSLANAYDVQGYDLRQALFVTLAARSGEQLQHAIDLLTNVIHKVHAEDVADVPHDTHFTPPPINGYRTLRGDEVNMINKLKAKGQEMGILLESVIDMYQAEDAADHDAMGAIQARFNEQVQAAIAADEEAHGQPKEGHEQDTLARRQALIAPLEEAAKQELGVYSAPAKARLEGARWLSVARTHFQQGLMAAVRAVARPDGF